jgi:hypothetical protein
MSHIPYPALNSTSPNPPPTHQSPDHPNKYRAPGAQLPGNNVQHAAKVPTAITPSWRRRTRRLARPAPRGTQASKQAKQSTAQHSNWGRIPRLGTYLSSRLETTLLGSKKETPQMAP